MALTPYHVTAAAGMNMYFGNDMIDGWPIGPVKVVQNQTFYVDTSLSNFNSRYFLSQSANYAAGVGTIAPAPGTQVAWFRQGSGIPGQESE